MSRVFDETLGKIPFPATGTLLFEPLVLKEMMKFQQVGSNDIEAGGILLGYRRGIHLQVTGLTTPQPGDARSRFSFKRRDERHQAIALERWRESGCTMDYLGEWHTHPEHAPTPSTIDSAEWEKILHQTNALMIFAIVGTSADWWLGVGKIITVKEVKK